MLQIEGVHFGYVAPILRGWSLTGNLGEVVHLQGPNGVGKTTLLRLVAGVLLPGQGSIFWNGNPMRPGKPRIGYVPAGGASFYPRLSVAENLDYFGALAGLSRARAREQMRRVDPFGIDFWDLPLEACSQGMKQKVSWVRALMHEPQVLLLDEAWNALDSEADRKALAAVETGQNGRFTIVVQHGKNLNFPKVQMAGSGAVVRC